MAGVCLKNRKYRLFLQTAANAMLKSHVTLKSFWILLLFEYLEKYF